MNTKIRSFILLLLLTLCLVSCGKSAADAIPLGDGLPDWTVTEPRKSVSLTAEEQADGLSEKWVTDTDHADILIYRLPKEGKTLSEIGNEEADIHGVFCQITQAVGCDTANFLFYSEENDAIAQTYIFEGKEQFVELVLMYKSERFPLGDSGLTFALPKGYLGNSTSDGVFPYEVVYTTDLKTLPTVKARQFAKDYFTPETYSPSFLSATTPEEYAAFSEDGWTLEEELAYYAKNAEEVLKNEIYERNGFRIGFIGYTVNGKLQVRALIDRESDFLMLTAEDNVDSFRHIVTALLDSID